MAFLDKNPVFETDLLQGENIVKVSEESLDKEISLPVAPALINVGRNAHTLRFFHAQIICKPDHGHSSSHIVDVQILVKGLRSAKSVRITRSEIDIFSRIVSEVGPWAENHLLDQIMLVQTTSDEDSPFIVLPFILSICADNPHCLGSGPSVAPHIIPEIILVIFKTCREVRRHEQAIVELMDILHSSHPCEVSGISICIRVHSCSVITIPVDVLERNESIESMLLIPGKLIVLDSSCVYAMLCLLGNHCLMRRKVKIVSSTPELLQVVILCSYLGIETSLDIASETHRLTGNPGKFRESVPVCVPCILCRILSEDSESQPVILRDD